MKIFLLLPILFFVHVAAAQNDPTAVDESYNKTLGDMQTAFFTQHFDEYKTLYNGRFKKDDTMDSESRERYVYYTFNMAEIMASEKNVDEAAAIISNLIKIDEFENWDDILGDVVFDSLRKTKAGKAFQAVAREHLLDLYKNEKDPHLAVRLKILFATDRSNEFYNAGDSLAYSLVQKRLDDSAGTILDKYGYPGVQLVGDMGSVIGHIISKAPFAVMMKYRPIFVIEGRKGNIPNGLAGVLIDRISVAEKGTQLYGTQYHTVKNKIVFYPIADAEHVDVRRKEVGFKMSFKDYQKRVLEGR